MVSHFSQLLCVSDTAFGEMLPEFSACALFLRMLPQESSCNFQVPPPINGSDLPLSLFLCCALFLSGSSCSPCFSCSFRTHNNLQQKNVSALCNTSYFFTSEFCPPFPCFRVFQLITISHTRNVRGPPFENKAGFINIVSFPPRIRLLLG